MRRRDFVTALAAASGAAAQTPSAPIERKGRLKQSVMRVNFDPKMPFDDMCREAARLGAKGFDLAAPNDWPTLRMYGLVPTMVPGPATIRGFVARTIADLGFTGYIAHEYRPAPGRDPIQSLTQALGIMDV
jgi:hypothetical protein